jgi:signal transduction histidine kinase
MRLTTTTLDRGRTGDPAAGDGLVAVAPSEVFDRGVRRASTGLVAAGAAQLVLALVLTSRYYPLWWMLGVLPPLLGLILVVAFRRLPPGMPPARPVVLLCGLVAVLSVTASVALGGTYTGATNVAEALVGLGAFLAGLVAAHPARLAALALIAAHRTGLVLAGTGSWPEHAALTFWELISLAAAVAAVRAARPIAAGLDEAAEELAAEVRAEALSRARYQRGQEDARMLHDGVLDPLTAVARGTLRDSPRLRQVFADLAGLLRGAAPADPPAPAPATGPATLSGALSAVAEEARGEGLPVTVVTGGTGPATDPDTTAALTRAVREALRNVRRHGAGAAARLRIDGEPGAWTITVSDRGPGFTPSAVGAERLGVRRSMIDRVREVAGDVEIDSAPDRGTEVTVTWPAPAHRPARRARETALRRWDVLGAVVWRPILAGYLLMSLANVGVLVLFRDHYRYPWVAAVALAAMVLTSGLLIALSRSGLPWWATPLAVAAGVAGVAVVAGQLAGVDATGPADWAVGYSAMALVVVPYSRPADEVVVAIAALLVANLTLLWPEAATARTAHLVVITGGSGPTIAAAGAALAIALRRIVTDGEALRRRARAAGRRRAVAEAADAELGNRTGELLTQVSALAERLGDGRADPADPVVAARARDLATRLRADVRMRLNQSLLQALLLGEIDRARRRGVEVEVHDQGGHAYRLTVRHRLWVVAAAAEVIAAAGAAAGATAAGAAAEVSVAAADRPGLVEVTFTADGVGPPGTPAWQRLSTAGPVRPAATEPGRWSRVVRLPAAAGTDARDDAAPPRAPLPVPGGRLLRVGGGR